MNVVLKPETRELVINREIAASQEAVFSAWTDPQRAAQWWAPRDFTLLSCKMDVRTGGHWHRRMRAANGEVFVKRGAYREVVPHERLVFTYTTDYESGAVDPETVVNLTFVALGPKRTRLTLWHTGFETDLSRDSHEGGWGGAVDRLTAFCAPAPI
jgi:uncharacterized protein YndB with AHSA1/START domain